MNYYSPEKFISSIKEKPIYLFLGQEYLKLEDGTDYFLEQILQKYYNREYSKPDYSLLFDSEIKKNKDQAFPWLVKCSMNIIESEALQIITSIPWSGVMTSAIDGFIEKAFRNPGRDVQPIFDNNYLPDSPRNKKKLHIWNLFGSVLMPEDDQRPPITEEELWNKENEVSVMVRKFFQIISYNGILAIEGYMSENDWLKIDTLYSLLSQQTEFQTFIFSFNETETPNRKVQKLLKDKKLIPIKESLAEILLFAKESGRIDFSTDIFTNFSPANTIKIKSIKKTIPSSIYNSVTSTAHIITEDLYIIQGSTSKEKRYLEFKEFLYESSYKPCWKGIAKGFPYKRNYEKKLLKVINDKINNSKHRKKLIILHGQTASGKTIALSNIAFTIQQEGKNPVVFIDSVTTNIKREAIDKFCKWAEDNGAKLSIIIWDGMKNQTDYLDLYRYLHESRGRKILIIGSCYKVSKNDTFDDLYYFESPSNLNGEINDFLKHLQSIDKTLLNYLDKRKSHILDNSFLVFLYRVLPPSRKAIIEGLEHELGYTEDFIRKKSDMETFEKAALGILADALKKAGLIEKLPFISNQDIEIGNEKVSELQELINIVMVTGQFNLSCPFDLLMRATKKSSTENIISIFQNVDIFRWTEDPEGNIYIGSRAQLEAEIIVKQRIGGWEFEIDYFVKLLSALNNNTIFQPIEVNFGIELVQKIGPNKLGIPKYEKGYFKIANCLTKIREENGIKNPRLMLQESMFYRESIKKTENIPDTTEPVEILRISSEVSLEALRMVKPNYSNRKFRSQIMAEIASTNGQLVFQLKLNKNKSKKDIIKKIEEAYIYCYKSHSLFPQNIHAIDIIIWIAIDYIKYFKEKDKYYYSIIKNVINAFNLADIEGFEGESLAKIKQRKSSFYEQIGKIEISEKEFNELIEMKNPTGIYFRALNFVHSFLYDKDKKFSSEEQESCKKAYELLMKYESITKYDVKCNILMLRVWFAWKTGLQLFSQERACIAMSYNDWSYLKSIIQRIIEPEEFEKNLKLQYILAIACYHISEYNDGETIFKEIESESRYHSKRIWKYNLLCDVSGKPKEFTGSVKKLSESGKGYIFVTEFQKTIPFMGIDIDKPEINIGDNFSFKIAFSLFGPIADFR